MFDEEPDGDPHGECALEIARLRAAAIDLLTALMRIERIAASEAPSEELQDAQADLRRIYDEARAAIAKANP